MTSTKSNKTNRITAIIALIIVGLLCFTLFFTAACKEEEKPTSSYNPSFSYSETDDGIIKNASFNYGTYNVKLSNYPKTSVSGWTITKSSNANSGAIKTTDEAWNELLNSLYSQTGILEYVKTKAINEDSTDDLKDYSTFESVIKSKIKEQDSWEDKDKSPSSSDVKKYVVENYFKKYLKNPNTHTDATDDKVYMLNNYVKGSIGYGSIQKLTSSTEITLNKGEFAKVSVWVKTANLNENTAGSSTVKTGANIRITNSFNSTTQKDFGIFNITDTDWTQYSFYLKADEVYETKFTLVLGLGYDDKVAEGTVYFDDVVVEHLEELPAGLTIDTTKTISYNNDDDAFNNKVDAADARGKNILYDMSINVLKVDDANSDNYIKTLELNKDKNITSAYTVSDGGNSTGGNFGSASMDIVSETGIPYGTTSAIKVNTNKASYTVTIKDYDTVKGEGVNFAVGTEQYVNLTFFVKNKLNKFYASDITFIVKDVSTKTVKEAGKEDVITVETTNRTGATITEISDEWVKCSILVKNNWKNQTTTVDGKEITIQRSFYIDIVVGPTNASSQNVMDYALGDVYISAPLVSSGSINQYTNDTNTVETDYYNYYSLFSSSANGSTALYAGMSQDYSANETDTETYSLTVAPSDIGVIQSRPATPKGYKGITSEHYYITNRPSDTTDINANANAGLINSKFLSNYNTAIQDAFFNNNKDGKNIQPIVIYNNTATSYGYIGANQEISASSYAKVSVNVRVVGDAKAYIYLVDVSGETKSVMTFNKFTTKVDKDGNATNKEISAKELVFTIENTTSEDDGWKTVEFYIATGANEKSFRVELWNGSRDGNVESEGVVFFNDISINTSGAFTEVTDNWREAFITEGNPLYTFDVDNDEYILYTRDLTTREKEYNKDSDRKGNAVSYEPTVVWAQNDSMIYAIYNTLDPVEVDPYDSEPKDEETTEEDATETDSSAFWLSFSSILLGVALVLAILMLFIKNIRRRRKANASDAKSHYKVTSRTKKVKQSKPKKVVVDDDEDVEEVAEEIEDVQEETEEVPAEEQSLDSYVYGDVQDFGEEDTKSEEENSNKE